MNPIMRNAIVKNKESIKDGKEMSEQPHFLVNVAIVNQVVGKHLPGESPSMNHRAGTNSKQN